MEVFPANKPSTVSEWPAARIPSFRFPKIHPRAVDPLSSTLCGAAYAFPVKKHYPRLDVDLLVSKTGKGPEGPVFIVGGPGN